MPELYCIELINWPLWLVCSSIRCSGLIRDLWTYEIELVMHENCLGCVDVKQDEFKFEVIGF
jgi:hypothetical protein